MRKLRLYFAMAMLAIAAPLSLAACDFGTVATSPVPTAAIDAAREVSVGLDATYAGGLKVATIYAKQERCGPAAAPPPLCSTAKTVLAIEAGRVRVKAALTAFRATIADASASKTALAAAQAAAQDAVVAFISLTKGG